MYKINPILREKLLGGGEKKKLVNLIPTNLSSPFTLIT